MDCNVIVLTKFCLLVINLKLTSSCIPMNDEVSLPDRLPTVPETVKISPQCIESMMRVPESNLLGPEWNYEIEIQVNGFSQMERRKCWWFFHVESNDCVPNITCNNVNIMKNEGCRKSFLDVYDGKGHKMRYCGMLSPHSSLQYHSLSHYKGSRSLDAFDIKFEDDIGVSQIKCQIGCTLSKLYHGNEDDENKVVNQCPQRLSCIGMDQQSNENEDDTKKCSCGMPFNPRIVGGNEAKANSVPWQVALLYKNRLQCGGTLISSLYVLTAGHCVMDGRDKSRMTLLLGRHNLANLPSQEKGHQSRKVNEIYRHPSFSLDTFDFDIALLQMDKAYTPTDYVYPACLPESAFDKYENIWVNVSGWGSLNGKETILPDKLQIVEIKTLEKGYCGMLSSLITDNMICAGGVDGKDACQGDSGGPLTTMDSRSNTNTVIGVVSFGIGCGRDDFPGVYSRVTSSLDWINSILDDKSCIQR